MHNEDKEFLREGMRVGLWAIAIIVLTLTLIGVIELKREVKKLTIELNEVKK